MLLVVQPLSLKDVSVGLSQGPFTTTLAVFPFALIHVSSETVNWATSVGLPSLAVPLSIFPSSVVTLSLFVVEHSQAAWLVVYPVSTITNSKLVLVVLENIEGSQAMALIVLPLSFVPVAAFVEEDALSCSFEFQLIG